MTILPGCIFPRRCRPWSRRAFLPADWFRAPRTPDRRFWCTEGNAILSDTCCEVHRPLMFGDSHFFAVAPSGACWCIDGIVCFRIKILRSEFGGYTAHHLSLYLQCFAWRVSIRLTTASSTLVDTWTAKIKRPQWTNVFEVDHLYDRWLASFAFRA